MRLIYFAFLCLISLPPVAAQSFPDRPVRLVVGFPPGAGSDIVARFMARGLGEIWKQPVVVENRAGAGGNIAAEVVAKATPDGYTLLLYNNSYAMSVATSKNLPFDVSKDFVAVGSVATSSMLVLVNNDVPVKSVKELVALAKAKPGTLNFGSSGIGTPQHLAGELFNSMAGIQLTHVPYKGAVPSLVGLAGNEIQVLFGPTGSVLPVLRSSSNPCRVVVSEKIFHQTASCASASMPIISGAIACNIPTISFCARPCTTPNPVTPSLVVIFTISSEAVRTGKRETQYQRPRSTAMACTSSFSIFIMIPAREGVLSAQCASSILSDLG